VAVQAVAVVSPGLEVTGLSRAVEAVGEMQPQRTVGTAGTVPSSSSLTSNRVKTKL
jgi:hypothetical protein